MRRLLCIIDKIVFRFALLLSIGSLLGCNDAQTGIVSRLDADDVGVYRNPVRSDAGASPGLDTGSDIGSDIGSNDAVVVSSIDAGVIDLKTGSPDMIAVDSTPQPFDSRVSFDVDPTTCMQQVIANGYANASASCANPPSSQIAINKTRFETATDACRFAIDCYAQNACPVYNSMLEQCLPCMFLPWSSAGGSADPWSWLTAIITPYCPHFFHP